VDKARKQYIEELFGKYHHPEFLSLDPLEYVHGLSGRENREIGGLVCSALAYGRVEQIRKGIKEIFRATGSDIYGFCREVSYENKKKAFRNFTHRFNTGRDVALLLECVSRGMSGYGSIEGMFVNTQNRMEKTIKEALDRFVALMVTTARSIDDSAKPSFSFFFPAPGRGSTCKRLNMYLRWMVRDQDGIDLGIWKNVPASRLVMPVDTHIGTIALRLGLTRRKTVDWKMAEEITDSLRQIDCDDPVRFDFSLCKAGMVEFRSLKKAA
jgi:uncharacterized protein (TIGR02757 family)